MTEPKKRGRPKGAGIHPTQFRLTPETLAEVDYLRERYGLPDRVDVVRFLVRRAALEERRKEGK
jgi:metal-responsive CopG/Arc/MetJ family transcriptional regulator